MFRQFSPEELGYVTAAKIGQIDVPAREHVFEAGARSNVMYTVLSGWAIRYKTLPSGVRHILDFLLPGDFIGLQSPLTGKVRHAVKALTDLTLCKIADETVRRVFEAQPELGAGLMATVLLDEDRADRRLLLLGRQRPTQRLSFLFLELRDRLVSRGMGDERVCDFPLTYEHMADALGLSRAQLARSLAELRERGWASVQSGQLVLERPDAMARFCAYEAASADSKRALI
jgi:CRP-like cAMP-binding protein